MAVYLCNGVKTGRLWHADIHATFGQPNIIWDTTSMDVIWHMEVSRY